MKTSSQRPTWYPSPPPGVRNLTEFLEKMISKARAPEVWSTYPACRVEVVCASDCRRVCQAPANRTIHTQRPDLKIHVSLRRNHKKKVSKKSQNTHNTYSKSKQGPKQYQTKKMSIKKQKLKNKGSILKTIQM